MAGTPVPKRKPRSRSFDDDQSIKSNRSTRSGSSTPVGRKKKRPETSVGSESSAGTKKKKHAPQSSSNLSTSTPKSASKKATKKKSESTVSPKVSPKGGVKKKKVGESASPKAGSKKKVDSAMSPKSGKKKKAADGTNLAKPRRSKSAEPVPPPPAEASPHALKKPPSAKGLGRFSSTPASLKPSSIRPGLGAIDEGRSDKNLSSNGKMPRSPKPSKGKKDIGGNDGSRKPVSLGSMFSRRDSSTNGGDRGGGPGRGMGARAMSMGILGNRGGSNNNNRPERPERPERPTPRPQSLRAPSGATPPPPQGKRPRRATSDVTGIKRFQDAMGISPGPASRKTPQSNPARSDTAGRILSSSAHGKAPQSILRSSSHNPRSSMERERSAVGLRRERSNVDFDASTRSKDNSLDDVEEVAINFEPRNTPLRKSSHHGSNSLDLSGHSFHTVQSVLSVDKTPFEDDPLWKKFLRYIRILPPHQNEKPEKRKTRILTWMVLTLDFVAAMVSITTYDGVQTCCGVPIFSLAANIDWTFAIRIVTYVYLAAIFLEIIPVVRNGIPFNVVNPIMGFTITFAMFFEDRVGEAVCMWLIEAAAIFCEFLVYRIKSNVFQRREQRLQDCDKALAECKGKSGRNLQSMSSFGSMSDLNLDDSDSEDSFGGDSFGHDSEMGSRDTRGFSSSRNVKLREVRLLRERRVLRQTQKADRLQLRYHFAGVILGLSLVAISFILIVFIARSGGLCIKDMKRPIIFALDQLEKCDKCKGTTGTCEICPDSGEGQQCYYPYIRTKNK